MSIGRFTDTEKSDPILSTVFRAKKENREPVTNKQKKSIIKYNRSKLIPCRDKGFRSDFTEVQI